MLPLPASEPASGPGPSTRPREVASRVFKKRAERSAKARRSGCRRRQGDRAECHLSLCRGSDRYRDLLLPLHFLQLTPAASCISWQLRNRVHFLLP